MIGFHLASEPLGGGHVDRIRDWLQTCETNHVECKKTISGRAVDCVQAELPTRCIVIDCGSVDVEQAIQCHLEETGGKIGAYITLSHRWSDHTEACKTTTNNYKDRLAGRNLNLPTLFNDALRFAWALGIKYVWIDSLCIIQAGDKGRDWEIEALRMFHFLLDF